jgi:hypothetical protein
LVHLILQGLLLPEGVLTEEEGPSKEIILASRNLELDLQVDLTGTGPLPKVGKGLHSLIAELKLEATVGHRDSQVDSQVVHKMLAFALGIQAAQLQVTEAGDLLASFMPDSDMSLCYSASALG